MTVPVAPDWDDQEAVLASIPTSALDERMGIRYVEARPDRVVATMPVEGNTQPFGLLHGGASCVLAESLGSVAASLHGLPDLVPMGIDINATHHRAARDGHVTGTAVPLHQGRRVATYAVEIEDAGGRRVCTARITCLLVDAG
jgi:uncharacterized protein (TIGR00369 family)